MIHPCCKGSLQKGTKIISIVQLVIAIFATSFGISGLALRSLGEQIANSGLNSRNGKGDAVVASVILFVSGLIAVLMSILLLFGAIKRNGPMCLVWFDLSTISLAFALYSTVSVIISSEAPYITIINVIALFLNLYFLWVVRAFMKELEEETLAFLARTQGSDDTHQEKYTEILQTI